MTTPPAGTRWIAAAGGLVVSLDSIVNPALPALAASFGLPAEAMRWVVVPYVLTYALVSFAGGVLGDRVGHGRVFRLGLAGSAVAFLLCALAPDFGWLVAGRVLQGLAGGLVYGVAPGLVTLASRADERGRALGLLTAAMGLGFTLGPVAAGGLVDAFGWRAVFHLRTPVALAAFLWAAVALPPGGLTSSQPTLPMAGFLRAPVVLAGSLAFLANAGFFAIWLLTPFYLADLRGLDAWTTGLLFMLTPLGTTLAAPLAGRLADRIGARLPLLAGLAVETLGLAALALCGPVTPLVLVAIALAVTGAGVGLFQVPNLAIVLASFPAGQQGAAGGYAFLARTLGIVAGATALAEIFADRRSAAGLAAAFAAVFATAALAAGLGLGLAILGLHRRPSSSPSGGRSIRPDPTIRS